MSLLDDLREPPPERNPCNLCLAIERLEGDERAALEEASRTMSFKRLIAVSMKHGLGFGNRSIARHRNEDHTP